MPVTAELSDWMPTHEHFPLSKREGGKAAVDNAILAHRLCNRIDYSISVGRSYASDLKRIRKAREDAIRCNNERARGAESGTQYLATKHARPMLLVAQSASGARTATREF